MRPPAPAADRVDDYILRTIANGRAADITGLNRVLPAEFFHHLITLPRDRITPRGVCIVNAVFDDDDDFAYTFPNLDIPYDVRFENCEFRLPLNLSDCHFLKGLSFRACVFKASADFESLKIDGRFDLSGAKFENSMNAKQIVVGGDVLGLETLFKGWVCFDEAKIGHRFDFSHADKKRPARFEDRFDCRGATINHHFVMANALFSGPVRLDSAKFGDYLSMENCRFGDYASFGYVTVANDFNISWSEFTNATKKANFYGLKCGSFLLDSTVFLGEGDFGIGAMANDLSLCNARFESEQDVTFYAADIKGTAYLNGARFAGPVNFLLAHVGGNFSAVDVQFSNRAQLSRAKNKADDTERESTFNADFGSLSVDGFTFFNDTTFAGDVSFRNARIQNLVFDRVRWPATNRTVRLEGLTYQRIRCATNKTFLLNGPDLSQSWDNLRQTLQHHTPYSYDVYENLEAYFLREGQPSLADAVFVEGKRRERQHAPFTSKMWSYFLDWTVGHGRAPARAFMISILPLGIGCWMFRRKNMHRVADGDQPYNALWYSFDLMLPILDLWIKNKWEPQPQRRAVWVYACAHKFLGWVLIPTGLAAFAGIIK
jgi:hypothetical protein